MTLIGHSGLEAFPLALGGNTFGWTSSESDSISVLDAFIDGGGNLIDTADSYSAWVPGNKGGESETILGTWMKAKKNRADVIVATKVSNHPEFKGLAGKNVAAAATASLERLGTDYIDIYFAHFDDASVALEETVTAFHDLQVAGKIRHVAVSNYTAERLTEWIDIANQNGWPLPVALQPHYNLVFREPFESELAPIAEQYNIGVVPYYSLAAGFLTGKYRTREDLEGVTRGATVGRYFSDAGLSVIDALDEIAKAHETSLTAVALSWLRVQPTVVAPIASARNPEQLVDLLASAHLELTSTELTKLSEISAKI